MIENVDNFRIGFIFSNLNVELLLLYSTVLPLCSCSFEILQFCLHKSGFLCRLLIKVRKRKAFLEPLAKELNVI